jgi:hypothetical protein
VRIVVRNGRRVLLFSSTLANVGVGPLEVVPRPGKLCPQGQRRVDQAIYQDQNANGRFNRSSERLRVLRPSGCMKFHPAHHHWHVNGSARYWLTRPASTEALVRHAKVSFCLRDTLRLAGTTHKALYGACSRDKRQGISQGWGDIYQWFLPGQSLRLPSKLPRGIYCLHQLADPLNVFRESDETDNASVRALRIVGKRVTYVDADRCR